MRLRAKLTFLLGTAIAGGVVLSALGVYLFARTQLQQAAKQEMEHTVRLLATQSDAWFDSLKADLRLLAEVPLVKQTAEAPGDEELVKATNEYFQRVVAETRIYQSVNLMDLDAWCVASSLPSRIRFRPMHEAVVQQADFRSAREGTSAMSGTLVSGGTGRPCVAVSFPVLAKGRVVAVLRPVVDLAFYNEVLVKPLTAGRAGQALVFSPEVLSRLPSDRPVYDVITDKAYAPPDLPVLPAMLTRGSGFVEYERDNSRCLAAFRRTHKPHSLRGRTPAGRGPRTRPIGQERRTGRGGSHAPPSIPLALVCLKGLTTGR